MDQLVHVILAINKVCTARQRAPDCGPGLGEIYDQILCQNESHVEISV